MKGSHLEVRVLDSAQHAQGRRRELQIDRQTARRLGEEAVTYIEQGWYPGPAGRRVSWSRLVEHARQGKVSIPPDAEVPTRPSGPCLKWSDGWPS